MKAKRKEKVIHCNGDRDKVCFEYLLILSSFYTVCFDQAYKIIPFFHAICPVTASS